MLSSTEMCHVGFMTKLPWYLRAGSRIHLLRKWRAEDALRTISEQKMPSVGGIGAQVALMLRLPNFDDYDVSSVKAIIVGGGPSPKALIEEAKERFGAAYSVRYSSTESGGVGTLTAFDAPDEEALYTVGRPREGIELVIRDEERRTGAGRRSRRGDAAKPGDALRVLERPGEHGKDASATAGSTPETSALSTSAGACVWPDAARRCSSAAATTCTRWRWRRSYLLTRTSRTWP